MAVCYSTELTGKEQSVKASIVDPGLEESELTRGPNAIQDQAIRVDSVVTSQWMRLKPMHENQELIISLL
jgi:hypothetical protein